MRYSGFHAWITAAAGITGVCIFYFADGLPLVRYYLGDVLAVIFLYALVKAVFSNIPSGRLALAVMAFSTAIEVLQYAGVPDLFDRTSLWVQLLLGSRFEWLDILMYATGLIIVLLAEKYCGSGRN